MGVLTELSYDGSLFKRENSQNTTLDSAGCVICDSIPSCPECNSDEQCAMTTQTCSECPNTYCVKNSVIRNSTKSDDSLSSAQIGGIAGSLSSLVFVLFLIGSYFLYKKYKNKIKNGEFDEELKNLNELTNDLDDNNNGNISNNNNENEKNSNYVYGNGNQDFNKRMSQTSFSTMTNSVLTKASNVLNIAYVPGVTSTRPTKYSNLPKRNTRRPMTSIYSRGVSVYSKDTYFSDLENASIHGGKIATKAGLPKLVQIKQDDYDFESNADDEINFGDIPIVSMNNKYNFNNDTVLEEDEEGETEGSDDVNNTKTKDANVFNDNYILEEDENMLSSIKSNEEDTTNTAANNVEEDGSYESIQLNLEIPKKDGGNTDEGDDTAANTSTSRLVPNRYAALLDKKNQLNGSLDPFQNVLYNPEQMSREKLTLHSDPDNILDTGTDSESDSDSDSDEENIEMLLHNQRKMASAESVADPFGDA